MTYPFLLMGEPLALDLVNTCIHRDGVDVDLLDRPRALDRWLRAERSRIAWSGRVGARDLSTVRTLRRTLDDLMRARVAHRHGPAASVRALNRALALRERRARLAWGARGPRKTDPGASTRLATLLQRLAADALELLTGPDADRLRECAHPDCILLFLARNPRRRWCSGVTCGNRARVARHYRKTRRTV